MTDQNLALKVFSTTELGVKSVLDETSLLVPDGTSFEATERMLAAMKGLQNCIKWWIGDLLLYAERAYGEKYAQLLDATDFEYQTLRNICYTVSKLAPSVRRKELTFWHHHEVAALPQTEQRRLLKLAVDQRLSVAALRALVRNKSKLDRPNRVESYTLALTAIVKLAADLPEFSKAEFDNRPANMSIATTIAAIATDALAGYED